ncbi:hypothetical protein VPH35_042688 [Triticum aestivum]
MPLCGVFRGMVGLATPAAGGRKRRLGQCQRARLSPSGGGGGRRWTAVGGVGWARARQRLPRISFRWYADLKFQAVKAKMDAAEVQFTPLYLSVSSFKAEVQSSGPGASPTDVGNLQSKSWPHVVQPRYFSIDDKGQTMQANIHHTQR